MTKLPPREIHVYKKDHIEIEYFDIPDYDLPYILSIRVNDEDLRSSIYESLKGVSYRIQDISPWDENIYLPDNIDNIIEIFLPSIIYSCDNGEKLLSIAFADYFFNHFASFCWSVINTHGSKNIACKFLEILTSKIRTWELKEERLIHKGTPYYFLTALYFSMNDIDSGFASMFKAIEEDRRTKGGALEDIYAYKRSPAYMYASLIDNEQNYLYNSVKKLRDFLNHIIDEFNQFTSYNLSLEDLDIKFLNVLDNKIEEIKYLFIYGVEKYLKYKEQFKELQIENDFYKIKNSSNIFEFCLIADKILETKYETTYRNSYPGRPIYISGLILCLFNDKGWIPNIPEIRQFQNNLSPKVIQQDPKLMLHNLFNNPIYYNGIPINNEMRIMLLVWRLRNWGAHTIKKEEIFVTQYEDIVKWLLWSILIAIETL